MFPARQVRRPLVGIALSVVTGLFFGRFLGGPAGLWLSVSAFVLAWACLREVRGHSAGILYLACGVLACTHVVINNLPTPAPLLHAELSGERVEVIGTVTEDPEISGEGKTLSFRFRTDAVRQGVGWRPAVADIRIYTDVSGQAPVYGSRWKLTGGYSNYPAPRGGVMGFFRAEASERAQLASPVPSLKGFCYALRRRAARVLGTGLEAFPEQVQLLNALLLGYRRAMPPELYQTFAITGTLHIFAISGLHVGVMASIFIAVLKAVGVSRPRWGIFLIPALFLYVAATGMKPSALRAFTMAAVYFGAPLAGRRPDPVSSIALAAIFLLAVNPAQIVAPGFQLSFIVVSGIVMVHADVARQFVRIRRPMWTLPLVQLGGARPVATLFRTVGLLLVTSLAAWLFSAPLTARLFNTLSPVALVGNLAVIPLTFMIVLSGSLSLLIGNFPDVVLTVCTHAGRCFVSLLISVIRFLGSLPGSYCFVSSPPVGALICWYIGLVLFFSGRRLRKPAALIAVLSVAWWVCSANSPHSGMRIFQDQRTAFAVQLPEDRWIASCEGSAYGLSRLRRLLQEKGIRRITALAVGGASPDKKALREFCESIQVEDVLGEEIPSQNDGRPVWPAGDGCIRVRLQ